MGEAERRLNYPMSERTRFRVRVEINEDLSGTPRVEWVRHCLSLEEAQRGYIALRDRTGYGASQFGFGEVFDEAGQLVATVSYNGRLWAPSPDGRGAGWRPGAEPAAEAPETEIPVRELLSRLAGVAEKDLATDIGLREVRTLQAHARRLLKDPRSGLTPHQKAGVSGVQVWAGGPAPRAFTHGPSPHLGFLDALNEGDVVQGFNGRGDVLTEGVKTRDGVAWRRVHGPELDRAREAAADRIYELAEFGGAVILDSGGWERGADEWVRPVFLEPEEGAGDSLHGVCVLRFYPNSDEAASLTLDGEEMLIPDQDPNYPVLKEDDPDGPDTGF
jgi:hypothetical protein